MAVTADDVRAIYSTALSDSQLEPFIDQSALIVSEELSGKGLSEGRLDLITKYLAAHFLVLTEENGGLRRSKLGDADESYVAPQDKVFGLNSTRFGQQAVGLDTSGTLAASQTSGGIKAEFRVV